MLRILSLLVCALAWQQSNPPADTAAWGRQVAGLQLSVAIVRGGGGPKIRITARNTGDRPVLLPLGLMLNYRPDPPIGVFVATRDQQYEFRLAPTKVLAMGRVEPLAIPMLPSASYTIEIPVTGLFRTDFQNLPMELPALVDQPGQLWVEWKSIGDCTLLDRHDLACWENKMVSNTLTLP
jgi:hypothetical protein